MNKILSFFIFISFTTCSAQIPIEEYRGEISALKNEQEIENYWQKLHQLDQTILVNTKSIVDSDSISICNMIRTAFMFEIHGTKIYKPNNVVPILNLSHSRIGTANLAFWPIIQKCSEIGGVIETYGGTYPAYELETISLAFYNYSLLNQETLYPDLINKLDISKSNSVINHLIDIYENQKKLEKLKPIETIGKWTIQPFKNLKEDGYFEFVKMSDNLMYVRTHGRIQRLILKEEKINSKIFRVENEPFNWTYEYQYNGELTLIDDNNLVLINYSKYN